MGSVFLKLLNLSITASWLILAVVLARLLLKKAPKWISCVLWALVAIRLICPFSLESALSLIPSSEIIPSNIEMMQKPAIDSGIPFINEAVNPVISSGFTSEPMMSANPLQIVIPVLAIVWISGMFAMLLYAFISYIRLKKSVGVSVPVRDNILACDDVRSPFILGIIKPLIYVPSSMDGKTLDYVITHEAAHIKRRDHWWKPLGFLLLSVYWFNPFCWLAYILLCRDIEMACDEKVIRDMDKGSVAAYSQAILDCSFPRRSIAACPLAFGEVGVKERVKSVLNYKKPAFCIVIVAVLVCIVVAVCFGTNPLKHDDGTKWDCSVSCIEASTQNHYVINYSDVKVSSRTGTLTFQNRNGFDIIVHILQEGEIEVVSNRIPAGGCYSLLKVNDKPCTIGVHADVDVNTEIKLFVYDGEWSEPFSMIEHHATKWFDCLHGDEIVWDGRLEINLDEFPGVTFRAYSDRIETVTDEAVIPLYTGMPIWSAYFCDLTGDGLPELCSSLSFGSGIVDNRVVIYDYANGISYSIEDRGVTDYVLRQNDSDGQLYVDKRAHMGGGLLSTGRLVFQDDCIQVLWPEKNNSIKKIIDPTDDINFSYDTTIEKFYEDDNNEYFFGGIYSEHVIVQYANGSEEDITAALCSGRASISDLDRFDIRYWAEPKKFSFEDPRT